MSSGSYCTEFILNKDEYSPGEFFEIFKKNLPQLISVTQGFYGEKQVESFERGQTLYIREHTAQRRVVATVLEGPRLILGQPISIPIDYDAEFSILKKGKPSSKKTSLSNAVARNKFPLKVMFHNTTDTDLSRFEGKRLILRLTKLYDDVFFLGHQIIEGKVTSVIQALPLFLREMRVSVVTGCKDYSELEWVQYKDLLHYVCTRQIKLDTQDRNRGIALYVTDTPINPHTSDISVGIPTVYCSINDCLDDERVYEKLNEEKKHVKQEFDTYDIIPFYATEKQKTTKHDTAIPTKHPLTKFTKLHKPLPPVPSNNTTQIDTKRQSSSRLVESKKYVIKENHKSSVTYNVKPRVECFHQQSPLLPPRPTKLSENSQQQQTGHKIPVQYEADYKKHLQPQPNADKQCTHKEDSLTRKCLNDCTVKDIGDLLVELKLDEYKKCFKELLIDGVVLNALDENALCKECGMKTVEAIRLMAYVRKGHLVK